MWPRVDKSAHGHPSHNACRWVCVLHIIDNDQAKVTHDIGCIVSGRNKFIFFVTSPGNISPARWIMG